MTRPDKTAILAACSASSIPEGSSGLWYIRKFTLDSAFTAPRPNGKQETIPIGTWTNLFRYTDSTIHKQGELVMHDCPAEVAKHLQFMMAARGRVLITGLGLGCCVRGALANPNVASVTVIERDADVLKLVAPHMPKDTRLWIVHAEAEAWLRNRKTEKWDAVWHDVWTDTDAGEDNLTSKHTRLIVLTEPRASIIGAWAFPRHYRKRVARSGVNIL